MPIKKIRSTLNIHSTADLTDPMMIKIRFGLTEIKGHDIFAKTYDVTIDDADNIIFPNDLTMRMQTLCRAIALCSKYPNTYAGTA